MSSQPLTITISIDRESGDSAVLTNIEEGNIADMTAISKILGVINQQLTEGIYTLINQSQDKPQEHETPDKE